MPIQITNQHFLVRVLFELRANVVPSPSFKDVTERMLPKCCDLAGFIVILRQNFQSFLIVQVYEHTKLWVNVTCVGNRETSNYNACVTCSRDVHPFFACHESLVLSCTLL